MDTHYIYRFGKSIKHKQLAMFDLDFTIVKPKKGKFSKDKDDWMYMFNTVKNKLKNLKDHNIIIITNQKGIKTSDQLQILKDKLDNIYNDLKIPFEAYIAVQNDIFRKPRIGFWDLIKEKYKIDIINTFYVGDAVGRSGDFSDSDYKFALNLGVKFFTEQEFFNDKKEQYKIKGFNPKNIEYEEYNIDKLIEPYMILLMGMPGSGKSTFYKDNFKNINMYSQDIYKTKPKLIKELNKNILNKKSVVIEGLLPSKIHRKLYIDIAKEHKYNVYLYHLNHDIDTCKHMNIYRSLTLTSSLIPDIVYNIYNKNYDTPLISENIDNIQIIKQKININKNNINKKLFYQFLI
jgi:bifunctional polynucleotide phosphatase/kinase